MNIFKYLAFYFKTETKEFRQEAQQNAHKWMKENMPNTYKFEDSYRINYQTYMHNYISAYVAESYRSRVHSR